MMTRDAPLAIPLLVQALLKVTKMALHRVTLVTVSVAAVESLARPRALGSELSELSHRTIGG
jgi:hypothetical protein